MSFVDKSCVEFLEALASKEAVPGGGGASAIVGALGSALGSMVCNLTIGKKAYKHVEEDVKRLLEKTESIRIKMLSLVDQDAEVFRPLARAYGIKANTPEEKAAKDSLMEDALKNAATVPMDIVKQAHACLTLLADLAEKGSKLAISDVAVGALFLRAALHGGKFNVIINTSLMKDREHAAALEAEVSHLVSTGSALADSICETVEKRILKS